MILYVFLALICISCLLLYYFMERKIVYKDLQNRHVVVTGGSSGIGKAAAIEAAKLGGHVTIIGRDKQKLEAAVKDISQHCNNKDNQRVQSVSLDLTTEFKTIEKTFSTLEAEVGPVFMLVNCAGMCICGQFDTMSPEDIKQMIDLNYFGTAYPTRCVLPKMKKRDEGVIVFVSSEAALIGIYGYSAYSAGKWALRGLAEAVNMELIGTSVRLMLAYPPDTDTPGLKQEDLTKPDITKQISGSAGLFSPDAIGKQLIHDALVGKTYSTYSASGFLLNALFGGCIESVRQVVIQVFLMGILRVVMVGLLLSFHAIVRDDVKTKKADSHNSKKVE